MIKLSHFALIVFSSMVGIASTQAAPLNKYGSQPNFQPAQRVVKSPRDIAIERAVEDIKNADAAKRRELIKEYSRRTKAALQKGNNDEARFYDDILSRSKN